MVKFVLLAASTSGIWLTPPKQENGCKASKSAPHGHANNNFIGKTYFHFNHVVNMNPVH